jgi:hypothetical protein
MEPISIRYGESVTLPLDAGDATAVSADIYIGKPGETYVLTKHISLVAGVGTFTLSATDTRIPLDTYFYQINVIDALGQVEKYPSPDGDCDGCNSDFPKFIVNEALDEIEVS